MDFERRQTASATRRVAPANQPSPHHSRSQGTIAKRSLALIVVGYTLPTLYLFWGVLSRLSQAITGPFKDGDAFYNVWHLWIAKGAFEAGQDPAYTNLVFALSGRPAHVFVEYIYSDVIGWALQLVARPLAAYNLLIISSFILSGYTMYLLATHFLQSRMACFAAGWLYTFSTYHLTRAAGHLGLCTIQWLPFCAWRLIVFVERPSVPSALLAGLGVALVPLSDVYYVACFLVPFALVLLARLLVLQLRWFTVRRNLVLGAIMLATALLLAGPPLRSYTRLDPEMTSANQRLVDDTRSRLGADLASYVVPGPGAGYVGRMTSPVYARMSAIEKDGYLGGITLLLAAVALCFERVRRNGGLFWLAVTATAIVFSAGPTVMIAGRVLGRSPVYNLIFGLPPLSLFRAPNRTSVTVLLGAAMLAAFAIDAMFTRLSRGRPRTILAGAALAGLLSTNLWASSPWGVPYPFRIVPFPDLYEIIGRDRDDRLLLNLPLMPLESFQFYQTIHHKRLPFAFVSRITPNMIRSVAKVPNARLFWVTNSSANLQVGNTKDWRVTGTASSPVGNPQFKLDLERLGFRYVVLHHSTDADTQHWMREYLLTSLGMPFYEVGGEKLTAWCVDAKCPPVR